MFVMRVDRLLCSLLHVMGKAQVAVNVSQILKDVERDIRK